MLMVAGECPICGTGNRAVFRCGDGGTFVVMCDECDAVWLDPGSLGPADSVFTQEPQFRIPGTEASLVGPGAGWATAEEVERIGWARYVRGHSPP
jgi:hypothetical protein